MNQKRNSDNRIGRIFTIFSIFLSLLILTSCTGSTYPSPIPCGDTDRLIRAIVIANSDSDLDTIELDAGCVYELTEAFDPGGDDGSTGLPEITSEITIAGHGAAIVRSETAGTPKFRLILVGDSGYLLLQNLTLQNGYAHDPLDPTDMHRNAGGAIRNTNQLNLEYVTIQNNRAYGMTGGIFNEGNMGMIFSSISGSRQDENSWVTPGVYGVALHNHHIGASAVIVQSTIYGNGQLVNPGGTAPDTISNNDGSSMIFENSTISGNGGTAIANEGDLDLIFCTIASNWGGIHTSGYGAPTLDIISTLFSGGSRDCDFDPSFLTTNVNNMESDGTCGFAYLHSASTQGLLPLANNGGTTLTHALDPTSPAIDAVVGDCPAFEDQRDVPRPQNGFCDIGAYEYDDVIPPMGGEISIPPTETPVVPPVGDPGEEPSSEDDDPPTPVPSRCDLFDKDSAKLVIHDIAYGSTTLELFVQYDHPLWGLEEEVPGDTRPWEFTATFGTVVAEKCTYREYPGRIYCTFELTKDHFGYAYPLGVSVNFCDKYIYFHNAASVIAPDPPATDTPTPSPITCNMNLNKADCIASGGAWQDLIQVCNCP